MPRRIRMHILWKVYDVISFSLLTIMIWMIYGAGGGLMDKKWEMMKSMWEKQEDYGKSISFQVKPVAIPIPFPVAMPYMKAQQPYMKAMPNMKAQKPPKPWKAESKDIFWKMMIMKMMKGDKNCAKGCAKPKMCCPKMMMMPMMKASKKGCDKCKKKGCSMMSKMKASAMMCCDCSQMMMPMSGCDSGCTENGGWPMMNGGMGCSCGGGGGGWPMMNGDMGCSCGGGGGGWPDEEEEEDEDYNVDYEDPPPPMMGWDTNNVPIYMHPKSVVTSDFKVEASTPSRKGDNSDDFYLSGRFSVLKPFRKKAKNKR